MTNLFDTATVADIKTRVRDVQSESERHWGTMNAAQALAHCAGGMEMALGDVRPPRLLIGRVFGPVVKRLALKDDAPMRRNSPTVPQMVVADTREVGHERERLCTLIDRFVAAGPAGCTSNPHSFFGRMTPQEWAILMYKHLDHHLRQFGA